MVEGSDSTTNVHGKRVGLIYFFCKRKLRLGLLEVVGAAVLFLAMATLTGGNRAMAPRLHAAESAAIATLKQICGAQLACRNSGAIDHDGDGKGEFGYFAELAGSVALRSTANERLTPPQLPHTFADVAARHGITGGTVTRSGYVFQVYLPDEYGRGLPEADSGGVGATAPAPDAAEKTFFVYAWPSSYAKSGNRAFFINQDGKVRATRNLATRYSGSTSVPDWTAALRNGTRKHMTSSIAASSSGHDGQLWMLVN